MNAARRRIRYGAFTAVLLVAVTASVVIAGALSQRYSRRFDVTATGEHVLAPRTRSILAGLRGGYEIVLVGPLRDARVVLPQSVRRLTDVLDQFRRAAPAGASIAVTEIDTGSAEGLGAYDDLLARLVKRDEEKVSRARAVIDAGVEEMSRLGRALADLSPRLLAVRDAVPEDAPGAAQVRGYFAQRSGECAGSAGALDEAAGKVRALLAAPVAQLPIPDLEQAAAMVRSPMADIQAGLASIADSLAQFAGTENMPAGARDLARALAPAVAGARDRAGVQRDALDRLARLDLLRVAKGLRQNAAVLIVGPPGVGVTALEFDTVLPPPSRAAAAADYGREAEELLSTAIASLSEPVKPIVVLVHAQTREFLDRVRFEMVSRRLALRGIDLVMWDTMNEPQAPSLSRLDPGGKRPVVYAVFNTAAHSTGAPGQTGLDRAKRLGGVVGSLIAEGKPVLMSLFPSTLATMGEPDPTTAGLGALGITPDTGHPLVHERLTPEGRRVDAFQYPRALESGNPISHALRGLATRIEWPIALNVKETPGVAVTPLFRVEAGDTWAESDWLPYLQLSWDMQASNPNPPTYDPPRDSNAGPWTIALAAERTAPGLGHPQRLVVVGSNFWFSDLVTAQGTQVDGRIAAANPGNVELFESCVYWLAGQDRLIAQSAAARAIPVIGPVSGPALRAIRWGAIAGLPLGVLLLGAFWRVLRG